MISAQNQLKRDARAPLGVPTWVVWVKSIFPTGFTSYIFYFARKTLLLQYYLVLKNSPKKINLDQKYMIIKLCNPKNIEQNAISLKCVQLRQVLYFSLWKYYIVSYTKIGPWYYFLSCEGYKYGCTYIIWFIQNPIFVQWYIFTLVLGPYVSFQAIT